MNSKICRFSVGNVIIKFIVLKKKACLKRRRTLLQTSSNTHSLSLSFHTLADTILKYFLTQKNNHGLHQKMSALWQRVRNTIPRTKILLCPMLRNLSQKPQQGMLRMRKTIPTSTFKPAILLKPMLPQVSTHASLNTISPFSFLTTSSHSFSSMPKHLKEARASPQVWKVLETLK